MRRRAILARTAAVLAITSAILPACAHERGTRAAHRAASPPTTPASAAADDAPTAAVGPTSGLASYYAPSLAGHKTASGERYDPDKLTAAHRTLPFGTVVEVRRPTGVSVVVRINDRGPFVSGRVIDLSHRAADQLGILRAGTAEVTLRVLSGPTARE